MEDVYIRHLYMCLIVNYPHGTIVVTQQYMDNRYLRIFNVNTTNFTIRKRLATKNITDRTILYSDCAQYDYSGC